MNTGGTTSLIKLYTETRAKLDNTNSPRKRLTLIISFFEHCRDSGFFPPHSSFLNDFIPTVTNIILNSDLNFYPPEILEKAKHLINLSKKLYYGNASLKITLEQLANATDILNMQLLKTYFFLGMKDEGLVTLKKMLEEGSHKSEKQSPDKNNISHISSAKNKKALVNPNIYKETRAIQILKQIKFEIDRLNSFSDEEVNVLLVESEQEAYGRVQNLYCNISASKKVSAIEIENITDESDEQLSKALNNVKNSTLSLITKTGYKPSLNNKKIAFRYQNIKNIYRGTSFSLGAAVLLACNYLKYSDKILRYKISNSVGFTGVVDENGNLSKLGKISLQTKIEAAFFSWLKYIIIPFDNYNDALEKLNELSKKYPEKEFKIIPVNNSADVLNHPEIFKIEKLSIKEAGKLKIKKHYKSSISIAAIILITLSILLANKFLPRNIKPLPNIQNDMSIIYTPDRDTSWIFNNNNFNGWDTINFGDVAIGDFWFPKVEFWNNSEESENFNIYIDGQDKDEYELTWIYKSEQPEAPKIISNGTPLNLYVKFVPWKNPGKKEAKLIFESADDNTKRKVIYLKGRADYLKSGYSLNFADDDDDLVFEPFTNLAYDNFTISFWIKPYYHWGKTDGPIMLDNNNPLTNNKMSLWIRVDSVLYFVTDDNKTKEKKGCRIDTKEKIKFNEWNYISATYNNKTVTLILNDIYYSTDIGETGLNKIADCISFSYFPPEDKGIKTPPERAVKFYLHDFKFYTKAFETEYLIRNGPTGKDKLAVEFDFNFMLPKRVFDQSGNDYTPKLYGGITRVLDSPKEFKTHPLDTIENHIFKRSGNGYGRLNKNLFEKESSFTFQADYKVYDTLASFPKTIRNNYDAFFFANQPDFDMLLYFRNDSILINLLDNINYLYKKESFDLLNRYLWHRLTFTYDSPSKKFILYIDGKITKEVYSSSPVDITRNYMGTSIGIKQYYADPMTSETGSNLVDNLKIYNRAITQEEIYSDSRNGLLAYWTFENQTGNLTYDEIQHIPIILWNTAEIVSEEITKPY